MKPTCKTTAIALLQAARRLIDSGKQRYICHALRRAGDVADQSDVANELVGYIEVTLENDPNYEGGSVLVSDCLPPELKDHAFNSQMCRLAWIDAMIRDLETNGELP